ncbi:hypothetical protein CN300_01060 [Bacillus thuringiensis]|uniref:aminotransferase class V-fold PLP-dependent enzyme n=1 Tax=Bacillus TaxID=1386 RepID=UPI00077B0956|nr:MULTISPECIES: aminotransferase class V-fold PLP-dependent enzyme [Bacillus]KXY56673.1 hypothetical protein AT261_18920 [Bacillus cereus]KAB2371891.1 aminotransferase class V-fold PLP-dependent enzyme [Bacillus sp. RM2(2019)]MEB8804772.1 aminotransferase class V-fold PLP-dependent enzyme [Bacillus cereus]PEC18830.1 hypothetical protein CON19_00420 [Bacillus thuringiensis]PEV04421.1 hypothetical protein CN418_30015 [Bacillus thuringiensis]
MNIYEILDMLLEQESNKYKTINLIPSENEATPLSRLPLMLDIYNRYFFNVKQKSDEWFFRGAQEVHEIETEVAIPLLQELGQAKYVNLRPLSGLNCSLIVLKALGGGIGANILAVSPEQGGHFATKDLGESIGLNVEFIPALDEHNIDFNCLESELKEKNIHLVYVDQSNCLFPIDIERLVETVKQVSPKTIVHVDVSHWLGLIFGNVMKNPLALGADSFGGSTHKTFPGPQKAIFFTNNIEIEQKVKEVQSYMVSSHHFGTVASLAISLLEFRDCGGFDYAQRIVGNAKILASELHRLGYDVKGKEHGYTVGHQVWMSTDITGVSSYEASERLYKVGIRVNVNNTLPGFQGKQALRLGVNEITRHGAQLEDVLELATIIDDTIRERVSVKLLQQRVAKIRTKYINSYGFSMDDNELHNLCMQIFSTSIKEVKATEKC